MTARILDEIELVRKSYELDFKSNGNQLWLKIKDYRLPEGTNWNMKVMDVCVLIPNNYPAAPPYGIYVPSGLRFNAQTPATNYQEIANNKPQFEGNWGLISWAIDGQWVPKEDIVKGDNLLNVIHTYADRFKMGRI